MQPRNTTAVTSVVTSRSSWRLKPIRLRSPYLTLPTRPAIHLPGTPLIKHKGQTSLPNIRNRDTVLALKDGWGNCAIGPVSALGTGDGNFGQNSATVPPVVVFPR